MNPAMSKTEASGDEGSLTQCRLETGRWPSEGLPGNDDARGSSEPLQDDAAPLETPSGRCAAATEQQIADWIAAVVDQDERALAALYDATFSRVFGLVRRIVHNTAMAEEVVEDAYFQVWRQAVRFDPSRGSALTWLLAIARSRAIDALRREVRFRHEDLDDDSQPEVASQEMPTDELLDLARHQSDLHQALMLLGAQPRQLVSLAFFRGLSHEEIAQQTQLPLGTVKSQIRRALLSLRQILGESGALTLA
jgi:RNA polymerase sigma factor (sigma-70 family)